MWVAGDAQDLMWLTPIDEASVRGTAGRASYVPAPIQEEVIRALSDEEQTILYACVAFVFGSPPDGGEWQPFQSAEIDSNGLVNIKFSCGR